ncbi:uncharacterized protein LOC109817453 [Cajanus cajan]|uniref:DUF4057 domain-containing protein n=1 Tax=Cajanus cajan TaxID=3821 RepID=A0A151RMI9_CAJCA|nr:uncharacterized protein LOC109817453 [Cajanus cajan]KYP43722.1 hypothetical protein KK1_034802 [Cajanus cajan]
MPLRNPHSSTADLLTWPEQPPPLSSASGHRSRQTSDRISEVLRGSQFTEAEAQSLTKKKSCFESKMKETTGSGIISGNAEDTTLEGNSANAKNKTSIRVYQQARHGISQISFGTEENISPKKPTSPHEIAKQRELSGSYQSKSVAKIQKQTSSAKTKELSGSDIFAPPPEIVPRSFATAQTLESKASRDMREPVPQKMHASAEVSNPAGDPRNILFSDETVKKTLRQVHLQKSADLTGNNIFQGDVPAGSPERPSSRAKLREMAGNDIFADGKAETREYIGSRRPPSGGSRIALV